MRDKMMHPMMAERLESDFNTHKVDEVNMTNMGLIRMHAKQLAMLIADVVPLCREQSTALTRLEEVMFHANAGISRHYQIAHRQD